MFYLFVLESIGTSELLLIGLVALIIFGPRKLPEFARMLGKARNEFKRTTDDFRQTWEREVDFENDDANTKVRELTTNNTIQRTDIAMKNEIVSPEIKEVTQEDFQNSYAEKEATASEQTENNLPDKRNWL